MRLLLLSTGNCDNRTLLALVSGHWDVLKATADGQRFLELTYGAVHIHE